MSSPTSIRVAERAATPTVPVKRTEKANEKTKPEAPASSPSTPPVEDEVRLSGEANEPEGGTDDMKTRTNALEAAYGSDSGEPTTDEPGTTTTPQLYTPYPTFQTDPLNNLLENDGVQPVLHNEDGPTPPGADDKSTKRSQVEVRPGVFVDPSDVKLYNLADQIREREEEEKTPKKDEEPFVVGKGDKDNPYKDHNATEVAVTPWDGVNGKPNDSLVTILRNQGYSDEQIYEANKEGKNLIDLVAETNEIEDPNVVNPGDELIVPTTQQSTEEREAFAEGRTLRLEDGTYINPSDKHLYNLAEDVEKRAAESEGRTLQLEDGTYINPSDKHLYNLANAAA